LPSPALPPIVPLVVVVVVVVGAVLLLVVLLASVPPLPVLSVELRVVPVAVFSASMSS